MIHVLLDTSIYRQDPHRKSVAFQAIVKMATADELTLHIPYFVKHEFLTYRQIEYTKTLQSIESSLTKLSKHPLPSSLKQAFKEQSGAVVLQKTKVTTWLEKEFNGWCSKVKAKLYPVHQHHGEKMAERYFAGKPPFREPKKREDIPDAFIFLTILDITESIDELVFVTADEGFAKACDGLNKVTVYKELDKFVKSDLCASALKEVGVVENFDAVISKLLTKAPVINKTAISKLSDELSYYEFTDPSIPDDNNEAMICMFDVPKDVGLDFEGAEYYGSGIIAIPFEFEMDAEVSYYIFKSDFMQIDEERASNISVDEYGNRHYYEAYESLPLSIIGKMAVTLDLSKVTNKDSILDHLDALVKTINIEVSEISDVTVNLAY